MSQAFLRSALSTATALAEQAGKLAMQAFGRPLEVEWKADNSPVTALDRRIEAQLRQALAEHFPTHGVLGEEAGGEIADCDYAWILDPIDGTRSFARGIPVFGIQLALTHRQRPILGVIHLPALGETLAAADGLGCRLNGELCRVSSMADPARALIHVHERQLARERSPALDAWLAGCQLERNWGDCYSFVLVASGRAEAALDPRMEVWDSAPLPVLLREAGGSFSDWQGLDTIWSGSVVTSNAALAGVLRDLLQAPSGTVL